MAVNIFNFISCFLALEPKQDMKGDKSLVVATLKGCWRAKEKGHTETGGPLRKQFMSLSGLAVPAIIITFNRFGSC